MGMKRLVQRGLKIARISLEEILTLAAIGALLCYILACMPSYRVNWNQDGSQVLFPVYQEESETIGLVAYDLTKGAIERVINVHDKKFIQGVWTSEKDQIIILTWDDRSNELAIAKVNMKSGARKHLQILKGKGWWFAWHHSILLERDRYLWLAYAESTDRMSIKRVDLSRGKVEHIMDDAYPFELGNRIGFLRKLTNEGSDDPGSLEVGWIDAKTQRSNSLAKFNAVISNRDTSLVTTNISASKNGSRIALLTHEDVEGDPAKPRLTLLDEKEKLLKQIDLQDKALRLNSCVWSPDSNTLWMSGVMFVEESTDVVAIGLLKVNVFDGESETLLLEEDWSVDRNQFTSLRKLYDHLHEGMFSIQPSISPDGRFIAVGFTKDEEYSPLYLVDLNDNNRVDKIVAPPVLRAEPERNH